MSTGHSHEPASCCHTPAASTQLPGKRTFVLVLATAVVILFSYRFARLEEFRLSIFHFLKMAWRPLLAGYFIGGILSRFIPDEYVSKLLAQPKKRSIFYASTLGFVMSGCSHGIIALSVQLYRKGASVPVVVAFLLASPWANLSITLLLFGFFGLKALYLILGALLIACVTGIIFQRLEKKGWIESNPHTVEVHESYSIRENLSGRFRNYRFSWGRTALDVKTIFKSAVSLSDMTLGWLLLGIVFSGVIAAFVPHSFFQKVLGHNVRGLLATLGFATVIEVCSEGTAPLALELYRQTAAFGNVFVFLMAGVITDFTEISTVWANIGRRAALWIPLVAVPQVVLLGIIANALFR